MLEQFSVLWSSSNIFGKARKTKDTETIITLELRSVMVMPLKLLQTLPYNFSQTVLVSYCLFTAKMIGIQIEN